ncbi:50S ribosome-binding GTPase domain-containing protein [Phthorimaea operculella]|nr:50S ribosome-binding GTPase domain-containing protein [Phthorimaea operculella]
MNPDARPAKLEKNFEIIKKTLSFLPFIDDIDQCVKAYSNKSVMEFAPAKLTIASEMPSIPVITDPDVKEAITAYIEANDLQKDIDLTPEDMFNVLTSVIKNIDEEANNSTSTFGKYIIDGFSPDPELWDLLSDSKMLPDYTIVVMENRLIDEDLMEHYKTIDDTIKNHREQFLQANDPLVIIKKNNLKDINVLESSVTNPVLDAKKIIYDTIKDTIKNFKIESGDEETYMTEDITAFTQSIENFRNNWDNTKPKIEDNYKSIIEVELENKTDVEVVEEMLLKLRLAYGPPCEPFEAEEIEEPAVDQEMKLDLLTVNDSRFLCETGINCPIAYFDYGVIWEGKTEFCIKHLNKLHFFSKEECLEKYQNDFTKYQFFNKPFKKIPPWRICVIGRIGSGKTTISKFIAKELGLVHIDYEEAVNNYIMPKHFKKVGRHYENNYNDVSLEEEAVEAFRVIEEGEQTDISHNEMEIRRMVYDYFEKGTPLLPFLVQKLLKKLWFEDPFVNIGIVIDGFPKCPQDVEEMVETFCVPDLIIDLEGTSEISMEHEVMAITEIPPTVDSQQIRVENEQEAVGGAEPEEKESFMRTAYNQIVELYPAPEDTSEWETVEDAQEKIDNRIETIFEFEEENIESLKDILNEQKIKIVSLDGTQSLNKVQRKVLMKLENLRKRSAFFEQTWIVNNETAEILLGEGFYFLSKFSRMCPVLIYENPNVLSNLYKVKKREGDLYPVIHRCYIYYIQGAESVKKFRMDPLKYIICDNILSFHQFPLKLAVIGSPKSGKSTLAKKIAKHYGLICVSKARRVPVPDERYDYLCEYHKPASKVPAFLNVVDIAGLVKGAAEGQGLGNAFLSHIKACDAIFNLCRAFDDEEVIHVDGEVNPVRDLETIGEELRLKDEEELMKNIEKLDRVVNRGNDKKLKPEYDTLMKIKSVLVDEKKHIRFADWSAADIEVLNKYLFLTSKPALYLVNLSEKDYIRKKNKWLPKLKEWIDKNDPGAPLIPFSGVFEAKLMDMDPEERKAFLKEHNITSALDKIIVQGYKALQLEYFFTAGADEVKAWTIQKGTKAPQAAGRIHTDFEKGFIMAEVMHFKDFKEEGTEAACKAAGKYRQQGRNYVVEDGDIIFFKFNAGAGLKDAKKK